MPRLGKGELVAEGIYRYKNGFRVVTKVKADGGQKEKWFHHPQDQLKLIAFRATWELQRRRGNPVSRDSIRTASEKYLLTIPEGSRRHEDATRQLTAWIAPLSNIAVPAITPQQIREQLATWQAKGYAASTLNHRRQELKNLFTFLNGRSGSNPVREVKKLKEVYDDARGQPPNVVDAIFAEMEDSATKTFLRVIWHTSLPHADIKRLREARFDAVKKTIMLADRKKGAGVKGEVLSLTTEGVTALQAFFAAGLEGHSISNGSMNKSFKLATGKAKEKWKGVWPAPENFHPYDLRHSRLTEALRQSKNLQGVGKLGRHKRLETTMRYVRALESDSMRQVVEAMERASLSVPPLGDETSKNAKNARPVGSGRTKRKST